MPLSYQCKTFLVVLRLTYLSCVYSGIQLPGPTPGALMDVKSRNRRSQPSGPETEEWVSHKSPAKE